MLRRRIDLSEGTVLALLEAKKNKVGGGYLTDKGALFLVASDLGVGLRIDNIAPKLGDLQKGQDNISVVARILSLGPTRKFIRKSDSSTGSISKIIVYDSTESLPVSVWHPSITVDLLSSGIQPGSPIKLSNVNVTEDIEGSRILNLQERGKAEKIPDSDMLAMEIPKLESCVTPISDDIRNRSSLIVRGKIGGPAKKSEFTRKTGQVGYFTSFEYDPDGSDTNSRVVIWGNPNPVFENLIQGEIVTLLNVRARETDFQGKKLLEFHGDDTTVIMEKWQDTSRWMHELAVKTRSELDPKHSVAKKSEPPSLEKLQFIARIFSIGQMWDDQKDSAHLLICDSARRNISVSVLDEATKDLLQLSVDDAIVCKPVSFDQIGLKAVCSKAGSLLKIKSERKDIPKSASLGSEVEKLVAPSIATLDVMSLMEALSREVQTKEGLVKRTELSVGDPTGEIKIYAWRGLSRFLETIRAGSRLKFQAVEIQSQRGKKFAVFKKYSRITLLNI